MKYIKVYFSVKYCSVFKSYLFMITLMGYRVIIVNMCYQILHHVSGEMELRAKNKGIVLKSFSE